MNDNNNNDADVQLGYALSQAVQDVPYKPAAQHAYRQVEQKAATRNNYLDVRFGRTEPLPPDWGKMRKCLGIVALLFLIFFGAIHLASKTSSSDFAGTSDNKYQILMMEKENECDCSNTIVENKLDINGDNEILELMAYDEPNVQDMFKETVVTKDIDNRTYDIIAIIPTDSQNNMHSLDDGKPLIADNGFAFEIEQTGVVSRTNVNIPQETSAISPRDELVVNDSE